MTFSDSGEKKETYDIKPVECCMNCNAFHDDCYIMDNCGYCQLHNIIVPFDHHCKVRPIGIKDLDLVVKSGEE